MELTGGYVRIYRKLAENPVWTRLSPAVLKVMIGFLLKANWKETTWYDGRSDVQIPRGSFVTSYASMAQSCRLSVKQIRGAFHHLERAQFAAYTRAQHWTMVSVLNYSAYQDSESEQGTAQGTAEGDKRARTRATAEEEKNKHTPPTPSCEGAGAGAPLFVVTSDANEKPAKKAAPRKPYADVLEQVARSIHGRHPDAFERRNLSAAAVEKKLGTILKHKRIPTAEAEACLRGIDRNHAGACASDAWTKDGGQYAKGLRNWLSTREELYDVEPALPVRNEPVRLMA
jgi:hypothetical protein